MEKATGIKRANILFREPHDHLHPFRIEVMLLFWVDVSGVGRAEKAGHRGERRGWSKLIPPQFQISAPRHVPDIQSHFENSPLSLLSRLWPSRSVVVAKSTNLSTSLVTLVPPSPGQLAAQAPVLNNTWNSLLTLCSPLPERAPSRSLGRARRPVQDQASASRPPKRASTCSRFHPDTETNAMQVLS